MLKSCVPSFAQSGADHERVKHGVERLRRRVVKIIECSDNTFPTEVKTCALSVAQQIVDVLSDAIVQVRSGDV